MNGVSVGGREDEEEGGGVEGGGALSPPDIRYLHRRKKQITERKVYPDYRGVFISVVLYIVYDMVQGTGYRVQ